MKTPERLKLPFKSGRLNQGSMDFLVSCAGFCSNGHSLILPCQNFDLDVCILGLIFGYESGRGGFWHSWDKCPLEENSNQNIKKFDLRNLG